MCVSLRKILIGSTTITLWLLSEYAVAGTVPQALKPSGAKIDPVEKIVCRHDKKLYEQGSVLEINGKDYMCTMNNGWVLAPKKIKTY